MTVVVWLVRHWRWLAILLVVVASGLWGGPHLWAWYHFTVGKNQLETYHSEEAQVHLDRVLRVWPDSFATHQMACRAAWRLGEGETAEKHLRECQRLHPQSTDTMAFEWALFRAALGDLESVETFLHQTADRNRELAPLAWEALALGYLRFYRILETLACVDRWLTLQPDNPRAFEIRGNAWQRGRSPQKAIEAFEEALKRDPQLHQVRWRMTQSMLDTARYADAISHLEELQKLRPNDPEIPAYLARCLNVMGRTKQARDLLDTALTQHPDAPQLWRTKAIIEQMAGKEEEAEHWFRKVIQAMPHDYESQFNLHVVLKRQNRNEEALVEMKKADQLRERLERLQDLTTKIISEKPRDPAVHLEIGQVLMQLGHIEQGRNWFYSALQYDPQFQAAHQALADLYEKEGNTEKAQSHRQQINP